MFVLNPHAPRSISPKALIQSVLSHRTLIIDLIKREIIGKYRGSMMGVFWSFFHPVLMLTVYTFVFSVVFKARWAGGNGSKVEFALVLFSGLIVFNLFSECVSRAPNLIIENANYVKKVVFPLEILPFVILGSSAFHMAVSIIVWLLFYVLFFGLPPLTILLLPIVLLPFIFMTLGICWFLSSLGVFLRDIGQFIGVIITVLMFMSPIFYSISSLPEKYHVLILMSPVTIVVERARDVMIWGKMMDFKLWLIYILASSVIAWSGFAWFQKTRKGFSDVL